MADHRRPADIAQADALPYCVCDYFAPTAIPLFATRMCAHCWRPYLSDLSHRESKMEKS